MNKRYRYEDGVHEEGVLLSLIEYLEVRTTDCGAWVREIYRGAVFGREFFVLNGTGKRRCHETKQLAWDSYKMRKRSQFRLCSDGLAKSEFALSRIEESDIAPESTRNWGKPGYWEGYIFD